MTPGSDPNSDFEWLSSAGAVRATAERIYALVAAGESEYFQLDMSRLGAVIDAVESVARGAYPDVSKVPYHSRLNHFEAGTGGRLRALDRRLAGQPPQAKLKSYFDLVITSVLLDAGAGPDWAYREAASGKTYRRSEGLAIASFDLFCSGGLSSQGAAEPLQADAARLAQVTDTELADAFQVGPDNPLIGVPGRAGLLRSLASAISASPLFESASPSENAPRRPGDLAEGLTARAEGGSLPASAVFDAVVAGLGSVWPGRETLGERNLGDVWTHSRFGRVPLHKLSQWLTYSLCDCLERAGIRVTDLDALTGLAEYRNGGLFLDLAVLVPKQSGLLLQTHAVSSDVVIEWRALTVALLDRTAAGLRARWGLSAEQLPLARVLEAGTWAAGRLIASQLRKDASPPLRIDSDATVF